MSPSVATQSLEFCNLLLSEALCDVLLSTWIWRHGRDA